MAYPRTTWGQASPGSHPGRSVEDPLAWGIAVVAGIGAGVVGGTAAVAEVAAALGGHLGPPLSVGALWQGLVSWHTHPGNPAAGFPPPLGALLPGPVGMYSALALVTVTGGALGLAVVWVLVRRGPTQAREQASVKAEVARLGLAGTRELRRAYPEDAGSLTIGAAGRTPVVTPATSSVGVVMGSQMGKTSRAVSWMLDAPGPLVTTTTKAEVVALTALAREEQTGRPTLVHDLEGLSAWPERVRWSPIRGCGDPGVAQERATALMAGVTTGDVENGAYFRARAAVLLRLVLHAAALDGDASVTELRGWVAAPGQDPAPTGILRGPDAAPGWDDEWRALVNEDPRTLGNVAATASLALESLARPDVAELCSPKDGEAFDPATWLRKGGSVHVIASGRAAASTAPLASALVDAIMRSARRVVADTGRRLDPPLLGILDELPSVAPFPGLPDYLADGAGQGIQLVPIAQAMSQYRGHYGRDGERRIKTVLGTTVVGGGIKDPDELEEYSRLAGHTEVRRVDATADQDGRRSWGHHRERRRVVEPEDLFRLRPHTGLLLSQYSGPVLVDLPPWWARDDAGAIEEARRRARARMGER